MTHLPALVADLALILITAGVVTILFKWLRQPVVLGYIVAGFLVGPHMHLIPSVTDGHSVATWSEIGIIFLLFALGLEFRFKKLLEVGGAALIAAIINMGAMVGVGYLVGHLLGWSSIESIFLGGMISMASTTIIIKAFADLGRQKQRFANIVFGILIIEDIAAILMMVLFSTIAVSKTFEGMQLVSSLLKLMFFIVVWFVVGIFVVPPVLKRLRGYLNDETLLIVSCGLCLGMVLLAQAVGFSAALGAFIMGVILAETVQAKRIEHLVQPLKNLFGAVFFVSVGMMIAPSLIVAHIVPILILTAVVLVGRIIFATLGVLASGESLKVSMQAGFSLAQIGEFSFIIATLGIQLGVISDFIYPVVVAVSVITTFTTPYGIKYSEVVYGKIEKRAPKKWSRLLAGYAQSRQKAEDNPSNGWLVLLKRLFVPVLIYFTLAVAIVILSRVMLIPFMLEELPDMLGKIAAAALTILLMSPFLYGITSRRHLLSSSIFFKLLKENHFNKGVLILLNLSRTFLCVVLILSVLLPLFPKATGALIAISILIAIFISFNPRYERQTKMIEVAFRENLSGGGRTEDES
ncbi:MAG: cation:proton antiporter [Prevotellaceae bacterium]|jgi:CPA2 family monovalent cation:H+ antiporter-2|nr:cation:proton antiporter [Prevotellaceae bacterium]